MCLGELAEVLQLAGDSAALVRSEVRTLTVSLLTLDDAVAPGDWVVCHSGFALGRLTPEEARDAAAIRATPPQQRGSAEVHSFEVGGWLDVGETEHPEGVPKTEHCRKEGDQEGHLK